MLEVLIGELYVRTIHYPNSSSKKLLPEQLDGALIKAEKLQEDPTYLSYPLSHAIKPGGFREATKEECLAYEQGARKITDISNSQQYLEQIIS